ncbi:DUF4232 domain-containing protein [Streptomyces sp. NPDC097704]|uniref:DUF4232 domain-containing protein n=1 Tax=Streptomyces sp. NPDC097704 TaxID=3157101 RepID=UPI0033194A70
MVVASSSLPGSEGEVDPRGRGRCGKPLGTALRGRKHRAVLPAAVLAVASLAMTACSSSNTPPPAASAPASTVSSPSATSEPSSAVSSPSAAPAPSSSGSSPSATPSPSGSAPSTGASRPAGKCTTGRLSAALTTPEPAAGSIYATLVFTNKSSVPCTMTGYPGVSYVAQNGVQSGNAAVREPGTITTVTLQPGGRAKAQLRDANGISGYDPAQCELSPAEGLRIYPPDRTAALFVPWKTEHCAGPTVHSLTIGPVRPG